VTVDPDTCASCDPDGCTDGKDCVEPRAIILDQPWQIELYHLQSMKYALRIEIRTGMRHSRGSVLRAVNNTLLVNKWIDKPKARKATALTALEGYIAHKEAQAVEAGLMRGPEDA